MNTNLVVKSRIADSVGEGIHKHCIYLKDLALSDLVFGYHSTDTHIAGSQPLPRGYTEVCIFQSPHYDALSLRRNPMKLPLLTCT